MDYYEFLIRLFCMIDPIAIGLCIVGLLDQINILVIPIYILAADSFLKDIYFFANDICIR